MALTYKRTLEFKSDQPQMLVIEPWAEEFQLETGIQYFLELESEVEGEAEINEAESVTFIFAWPGATFQLFDQDGNLVGSSDFACPPLPQGLSVSDFFNLLGINLPKSSSKTVKE